MQHAKIVVRFKVVGDITGRVVSELDWRGVDKDSGKESSKEARDEKCDEDHVVYKRMEG